MSMPTALVSQILDKSAAGYGAHAAERLLERHPDIGARFGAQAFSEWKEHLAQTVRELSAALEAEEPGMFATGVVWTGEAFSNRQVPVADLKAGLACLRDVLREELPEAVRAPAVACVDAGLEALDRPGRTRPRELDPDDPQERLALSYLEAILDGQPRRAVELIWQAVDSGLTVHDVYLKVLVPAQQEVGEMWHDGRLGVDEEHLVTATTQSVMASLSMRFRPEESNGKIVLAATTAGNVHDVGLRVVVDLFELDGWRAMNLGANLPPEDVARAAGRFDADLLILSATLSTQVRTVRETIAAVRREAGGDRPKILVGGLAFRDYPDLGARVGADDQAATAPDAVKAGRRLVGLD